MNRSESRAIDPILSQIALGYKNAKFVGTTLMPLIPCPKSGVRLMKFGKEAFIKYNMRRAPGADTPEVQYGYSSDPVALVQDSLNGKVPREWVRDTKDLPGINHGTIAVNNVMSSMYLGLEIEISEIATNPANYGVNNKIAVASADKWTEPSSKLSKQMQDYKEAVRQQIGVEPNKLVLKPADFNACKFHPEVVERFKYTTAESITEAMLAAFFELETVEVGKAIWTPDEGSALCDCWQHSVLAYVPPEGERAMGVPSYGYSYYLEGHPLVEEAYYQKTNKSFIYPVEFERRPYMTSMAAGFLIQNAS